MRHHLALVACIVFSGSFADAAPSRKKSKRVKVVQPVEQDEDEAERPRPKKRTKRKAAKLEEPREDADSDSERVALRVDTADEDEIEPPVRLRKTDRKARSKTWHVAVGPYLWASSVDANVSLGSASVSAGVDFLDIQRNARYGVPVLAEARYGRLTIYGDLLYGVVDVNGAKEVGPLMVTLTGTASSLLLDGTAGYLLAGGERDVLSLEARAGVRYQRTAISGSVDISGADVSPPKHVDAAADALAGAHVVVRPFRRFALSGTFDVGVLGTSTITWSAATDATVRVSKYVLVSLGWRTLTTERTNVSIVMHGPRAAVQLRF